VARVGACEIPTLGMDNTGLITYVLDREYGGIYTVYGISKTTRFHQNACEPNPWILCMVWIWIWISLSCLRHGGSHTCPHRIDSDSLAQNVGKHWQGAA